MNKQTTLFDICKHLTLGCNDDHTLAPSMTASAMNSRISATKMQGMPLNQFKWKRTVYRCACPYNIHRHTDIITHL